MRESMNSRNSLTTACVVFDSVSDMTRVARLKVNAASLEIVLMISSR